MAIAADDLSPAQITPIAAAALLKFIAYLHGILFREGSGKHIDLSLSGGGCTEGLPQD